MPPPICFNELRRTVLWLAIWATAFLMGCHDPKSIDASKSGIMDQRMQTICIDRLLMDVRRDVQVGSAIFSEHGVGEYDFPGIMDIYSGGITWNTIIFDESQLAESGDLKRLADLAGGELEVKSYAREGGIIPLEDQIAFTRKKLMPMAETSEARAVYLNRIKDYQSRIAADKRFPVVSGEADLEDKSAFAVRINDEYKIGYFDSVDKRIRLFSGDVPSTAPESKEAAAQEYARLRSIYRRRAPTEIPSGAGFCTAYGFFNEAADTLLPRSELEIPFRSLGYPNLVFTLFSSPGREGPENVQDKPDQMIRFVPAELGEKRTHGPRHVTILGEPGLMFARENGPNCYNRSVCINSRAAYVIDAVTFGAPDRPDRPQVKLRMTALMPDDEGVVSRGGQVLRPALKGLTPPPYAEGEKIFMDVLKSIRIRPGAVSPGQRYVPEVTSNEVAR